MFWFDDFRKIQKLSKLEKVQLSLSLLIRLSLLVALVAAIFEPSWTVAFVSGVALIATFLPWYLTRTYKVFVPLEFEFVLVAFIYASLFLGEVHSFYERFWWWDVLLHAGSGLAFGFIGFLILYSLHHEGRFQARPSLIAFLSFSVALSIGALWEIFEYMMDTVFGFNMQKNSLVDTMRDIIVDALGALIASTSGYFYLKKRRGGVGIFQYYLASYLNRRH